MSTTIEQKRSYRQKWRRDHPDYDKQWRKQRRQKMSEQEKAAASRSAKKHKKTYLSKEENREKVRVYQRGYMKRRGCRRVSRAVLQQMLENQKGLCAICFTKFPDLRSACVDHDHATGAVRGLLCPKCNFGLGMFSDKIEHLERAIVYLRWYADIARSTNQNELPYSQGTF